MKTRILLLVLLSSLFTIPAPATVTFSLTIIREVKPAYDDFYGQIWYSAQPTISDTTTPISYHRVESPTDIASANFGPTNTGIGSFIQGDAGTLINLLTNGDWKLWLNKDTPQERLYTFKLATPTLGSNSLGVVQIIAPPDGGINVSSNTAYSWSGPAGFDAVNVSVENYSGDSLASTATNWLTGPTLAPGTNKFLVSYDRNVTGSVTISTPTNSTFGLLAGWAVGYVRLDSRALSGFLSEGLTSPLAVALDTPGMVWETDGAANWFSQSTITHDAVDAARSGPILDDESTTLRTVIYGTNEISFWWKVDSEPGADFVEFYDNGNVIAGLDGDSGWQQYTHALTPGEVHVLEWTYFKDSVLAEGEDAAFLDQVQLASQPVPPTNNIEIGFDFNIIRSRDVVGSDVFLCFPSFTSISPAPITTHEVHSPNDLFSGSLFNSGTTVMNSLDDVLNEITNGVWTIYINRSNATEQQFTFSVSVNDLTTNLLKTVSILSPATGSTGVPSVPTYSWNGASGMSNLQANVFFNNTQVFSTNLPTTATNLISPTPLSAGTNQLDVIYFSQGIANVTFTTPVDSNSVPLFSWSTQTRLQSSATSIFVVGGITPVQLANPNHTGGNFQFQFLSQSGVTNTVQSRTNLVLGTWLNRTNIPGDGTLKTITLPIGSSPTEFFRISTE